MKRPRRHHAAPFKAKVALALARSSVSAVPQPVVAATLALMRQIDELHRQHPFAGSRTLRDLLRLTGVIVGRKHVATLMRRMGIAALYPHPRTTPGRIRAIRCFRTCSASARSRPPIRCGPWT
jgi:putative transposase